MTSCIIRAVVPLLLFIFTTVLAASSVPASSIPLAVRSPFLSVWLPNSKDSQNTLSTRWSETWNGAYSAWASFVKVDGVSYRAMGQVNLPNVQVAQQVSVDYSGTSSIFTMRVGPIDLTYTFISPIDPSDLVKFSMPFSYLLITASSNDGNAHNVQLYQDITAEWVNEDRTIPMQWKTRMTPAIGGDDALITHQVWQATSVPQQQTASSRIQDGIVYFSAFNRQGLTYQTGGAVLARQTFIANGKLPDTQDGDFRAVGEEWPVFAFAHNLGPVLGTSSPIVFGVGHTRENLVRYAIGTNKFQLRAPYYLKQHASSEAAMDFFMRDYNNAARVATTLDAQLEDEATTISANYSGLVQLSLRQAIAGMELTIARKDDGTIDAGDVMLFTAEFGGRRFRVNNIDQIYHMMPVFLYLNPDLLKHALRPILQYHKAGLAGTPYCVHNLGEIYPQATGPGGAVEMPVGASAYMLIMAAAHLQRTGDNSLVQAYYDVFDQFAQYLIDGALMPAKQYSMIESPLVPEAALQSNLAIAGIIGIRAMADLANAKGEGAANANYIANAVAMVGQWQTKATSKDGVYLTFTYGDDANWMGMFNLYADALLGVNLVPKYIYINQERFYQSKAHKYGTPIYGKRGWALSGPNMWIAAMLEKTALRNHFFDGVVARLFAGSSSVPLPDWFDSDNLAIASNASYWMKARPQVGAHFAPLALQSKRVNLTALSPASSPDPSPQGIVPPGGAGVKLCSRTFTFAIAFLVLLL
ncbi:DUF1793-domain-containing protein [Auriculariales sp. MPI-PUGE-AT-0066]|nr:DUF1793-domain-containing protein [Auriculariales sp. MPI-PUGE-AT-0066]